MDVEVHNAIMLEFCLSKRSLLIPEVLLLLPQVDQSVLLSCCLLVSSSRGLLVAQTMIFLCAVFCATFVV